MILGLSDERRLSLWMRAEMLFSALYCSHASERSMSGRANPETFFHLTEAEAVRWPLGFENPASSPDSTSSEQRLVLFSSVDRGTEQISPHPTMYGWRTSYDSSSSRVAGNTK